MREARPVTMETISSSWVTEVWGNGGMEPQAGVRARGLGTCSRGEESGAESAAALSTDHNNAHCTKYTSNERHGAKKSSKS